MSWQSTSRVSASPACITRRIAHDERRADAFLVREAPLGAEPVLAEEEAVVAEKDDEGVVELPCCSAPRAACRRLRRPPPSSRRAAESPPARRRASRRGWPRPALDFRISNTSAHAGFSSPPPRAAACSACFGRCMPLYRSLCRSASGNRPCARDRNVPSAACSASGCTALCAKNSENGFRRACAQKIDRQLVHDVGDVALCCTYLPSLFSVGSFSRP